MSMKFRYFVILSALMLVPASGLAQDGFEGPFVGGPDFSELTPEQKLEIKERFQGMKKRRHAKEGESGKRAKRGKRMKRFLEFVKDYTNSVQDPYQATGLAIMGMKDLYKKEGEPLKVIDELNEMLSTADDQKMRNVILFGMKQVYQENKKKKQVLKISRQIIKENIKQTSK